MNPSETRTAGETATALPLPLSFREFVTLMALLMSITAMSIDIMLPALLEIAATLGVPDTRDLPLVVTVFMFAWPLGSWSGAPSPIDLAVADRSCWALRSSCSLRP